MKASILSRRIPKIMPRHELTLRETGTSKNKMAAVRRNLSGDSQMFEANSKEDNVFYYVVINGVIAVFVFFSLVVFNGFLRQYLQYPDTSKSNTCKSPSCVRCRSANLQRDLLIKKLDEFASKTNAKLEMLERLFESLLYGDNNSDCVRQRPTTFGLLGLTSQAWHTRYTTELQHLLGNLEKIKLEVNSITNDLSCGWVSNTCPSGRWFVYHLYNQGKKISRNCKKCPLTTKLIESVVPFMKDCAFGNAVVSLVQPGTHITSHYGPTNCRLRCHLPLEIPDGCAISVDQEERQWKEGNILLFDDSYLHEVWHNGKKGDRIVLILDLWHPEVTAIERQAINFVFSNVLDL